MTVAGVGMRSPARLGWVLLATWALLALVLDVFWIDLYDRLFVPALLLPFALWVGLAGLVGFLVFRGSSRASVALLVAIVAVGVAQVTLGGKVGIAARFYSLRPKYQAVVDALEAGVAPMPGLPHHLEKGPPIRVAFPWPGGLGDNWCGVVFDPSGMVMKVGDSGQSPTRPDDPALQQVRMWFGGVMIRCEPLGGPWYYCRFT